MRTPPAPGMHSARVRAVLLDALGTLVELRPPAPALRARLEQLTGIDIGIEAAQRGFEAEIGHYLANQMRGGDEAGLDALRDDCAKVMAAAIGDRRLAFGDVRTAMMDALEFEPFPDVIPALHDLRAKGLRLVVASNWDCSLPGWLDRAGVLELLDGTVSSAAIGAAKPDPAVFEAALALAGAEPSEAVHVGDSIEGDIEGARAAGVRALLIRRAGTVPAGIEHVRSLGEVASLL